MMETRATLRQTDGSVRRNLVSRRRHRFMFPTVAVMVTLSALAAHPLTHALVEDWRAQPVGTMGVPQGWSELPLLQRALVRLGTLEIVEDEGQRALRFKTETDQHTIIRKKIRVDLDATP